MTQSAGFVDEVVTQALVQYVSLPFLRGDLALITLENGRDHRRPSTFGPAGLSSLDTALDSVQSRSPQVKAIAVTGKPFTFAVGADLSAMQLVRRREEALDIARLGHRIFRRLHDSQIPTFAFINGAAIGGGLELALHCHYRTLSSAVTTVALPECSLGLVPGWGGSQLVPRLIGPERAVKLIIENPLNNNRMLSAREAFDMRLADMLLDQADFIEQSVLWASHVIRGDYPVIRQEMDSDQSWNAALQRGRKIADTKVHGAAPAPYRALELIELAKTADLRQGFAAEDEALADLLMSDELHASLYAFDLVQRRGKRPVGVPDPGLARPITKVGVLGAGLMASQLAVLFSRRLGVPVMMTDLDQERLDKGIAAAHAEIDTLLAKGRISAEAGIRAKQNITGSLNTDSFTDADFVIEAIFEDLQIKKKAFADIEAVVSAEAVLATNTSSLSVNQIAADLRHPERVVGFHFFNPVVVMPLVEVARAERSDDATLATAFALGKQLKKSCVAVKDAPGFVVNRLLLRLLTEVIAAVDEGTPFDVADRALLPLGLPMTPLKLLGLVGVGVGQHVAETLHEAFPDRFPLSANMARFAKTGKQAIYVSHGDGVEIDPQLLELLVVGDRPSTEAEVRERVLDAVATEVRLMLDEGVVEQPQDIDLCMILGAGWPFHLGGITPYLDRTGVSERTTGARFLPPGVASLTV